MATAEEPKVNERTSDVRILERKLRRGLISRKDHDKYLKSLPDLTDKAVQATPDAVDDDEE